MNRKPVKGGYFYFSYFISETTARNPSIVVIGFKANSSEHVLRDVALVVAESVTYAQLVDVMQQSVSKDGILKQITLFDVYRPKEGAVSDVPAGYKSMAFRLELADELATLTDERISEVVATLVQAAGKAYNAKLRG